MNPITEKFQRFIAEPRVRRNPAPRAIEDDVTTFLRELNRKGELRAWDEADWIQFGRGLGLTNEEISELVEQAAGWVEDTTEHGKLPPEPAAWT